MDAFIMEYIFPVFKLITGLFVLFFPRSVIKCANHGKIFFWIPFWIIFIITFLLEACFLVASGMGFAETWYRDGYSWWKEMFAPLRLGFWLYSLIIFATSILIQIRLGMLSCAFALYSSLTLGWTSVFLSSIK